jgi:hypothetical protein
MKYLLEDINAKIGREYTFKPTVGNESLRHDSNNNGVRIVNIVILGHLIVRAQCSHTETFTNAPERPLRRRITRLITY